MKIRMNKNKKDNHLEEELNDRVSSEEETEESLSEEQLQEEDVPDIEENEEAEGSSELEELRNKYLRLVAEFDNYRKRVSRERIDLMQTAEKEVIASLLDVIDDADRAEEQMAKTEDINAVRDGASLIFNKLRKTLKSRGLREMDSLHNDYDAELQEAIAEAPAPSDDLKGKVIDDIQKGYYLNDKIIRHAKVVVGK